jgi:hypothetical protein
MEQRNLEAAVNIDDDQPSMPTSTGATSQNLVTIQTPGRFDVLLGRGKKYTAHPGNEQLQSVLNTHSVQYNSTTSRNEKTAITQRIVHTVQTTSEPPGRFLKFDKYANGWVEVDDVRARIKVSHAIRYASRYKKRKAPPANSEPSSQEAGRKDSLANSEPSSQEASTIGSDTSPRREAHQQARPSARSPLVSDECILAGLGQDAPLANSEPSSQEANTMGSDTSPRHDAHPQERPSDRCPLVFDESILVGLGQDAHSSNDTQDDDASVFYDRSHQQINEDLVP